MTHAAAVSDTLRAARGPHPLRVFDAKGKILGRLSTEIALTLRGKDDPRWVPYRDANVVVVVTNTDHLAVSERKARLKLLFRHTQRKPGALRILRLGQRMQTDSREVVRDAVRNMLPRNRLRRRFLRRLKLFRGEAAPVLP